LIVDNKGAPAPLSGEEFTTKDSEFLACDVECRLAGVDGFYLELDVVPGLDKLMEALVKWHFDRRKKAAFWCRNHCREGQARTRLSASTDKCGRRCDAAKSGQTVLGRAVFNTPQDAVNALVRSTSPCFLCPRPCERRSISAIEAGINHGATCPIACRVWDAMQIAAAAKANGAMFVGPNTLGVLSRAKAVVGMIGGRA